ncbi:phage holin family protein [Nocardia farcinica]|uniref:phage holin family protein n=1 Tax=Nocardia farcinica TaxID=37329 RepID=UPI000A361247|nr:phage holin family protein [Nocardia farcinica]MBA4855547.1 phage holin family protein [Nocardia farcinica]MBC9818114.1 phage holin family protein [Nocardia farcinica]MBF6249926.1 phage holin family protein [Nocardia farcinica]SUE29130.1 Protein of uncharacterised function (DUF1469) [Nocardia farcinica]
MTDTTGAHPTEQARSTTQSRSTAELVEDATAQVSRLIRDEFRLAQLEMQRKARGIGIGAGLAGAAGLLAFYGGAALVAAAVFALNIPLPDWAAALIVAAALLLVAGVLALAGKKKVDNATPPVPQEAVRGVEGDIRAIRNGTRR